jgi:two-component sensor histidine kinase
MTLRTVTDSLRTTVRGGLRPASPAAFLAAILFVAVATLVRLAIDLVAPNAVPFATYFPAVLVTALIGGVAAGLLATLLGGALSYWMFVPPRFAFTPLGLDTCVNFALFLIASLTIVWIAAQYRRLVRKLGEEEHYRQVVVDELGHRVKNKLATIHAILRHELRGHDQIWDSVAGRLRALSVADDFLVSSDEGAVDLKQILTMELGPYGAANVAMRGEAIRLFAKLPAVLALVFHELATNAAKYGALSTPDGRLDISWGQSGDNVVVEWVESGGPPVSSPSRRGFGSNLIERSLDGFGGSAKIDFTPGGVVCRIRFPRSKAPDAPVKAADTVTA